MTAEEHSFETMQLSFIAILRGDSPREVADLVAAREAELERLVAERDRRNDA